MVSQILACWKMNRTNRIRLWRGARLSLPIGTQSAIKMVCQPLSFCTTGRGAKISTWNGVDLRLDFFEHGVHTQCAAKVSCAGPRFTFNWLLSLQVQPKQSMALRYLWLKIFTSLRFITGGATEAINLPARTYSSIISKMVLALSVPPIGHRAKG